MAVLRSIAGCGVALALCALSVGAHARETRKPFVSQNPEFDASKFTCLNYTSGLSPTSPTRTNTIMARIWVVGFLDGYYKVADKLEHSDDPADIQKLDEAIVEQCGKNPGVSIYAVAAQGLTAQPYKLPTTISGDLKVDYTCGQHLAAKASVAMKADLAELWAFGVIEGAKSFALPELRIPIENKATILGAVNRTCANQNNTDKTYRDLAGAVADKVKMN